MFAIPGFVNHILGVWGSFFHFERGADLTDLAFANIADFLEILVLIGVLLGIPLAIVAILTQRAVSGQFNFAPKALAFKGKKMNPITGLGRMFGTKALVELGVWGYRTWFLNYECQTKTFSDKGYTKFFKSY